MLNDNIDIHMSVFFFTRVLVMTVAAEIAVESGAVRGPGTFLGTLIDVLWSLKPEEVVQRSKIEILSS